MTTTAPLLAQEHPSVSLDLLLVTADAPVEFKRAARAAWHDHLAHAASHYDLTTDAGRERFRLRVAAMVGRTTVAGLRVVAADYGVELPLDVTRDQALRAIADAFLGWYA